MPPERLAVSVACLETNPSIGLVLGLTEAFLTPGEPRSSRWNPAWDAGPYHGHPGTGLWRRVHAANSSLGEHRPLQELPRLLKASLDRRRAAG